MAALFRSNKEWVRDEPDQELKLATVYAPGTAPYRWAAAAILSGISATVLIVASAILPTI